MTGSQRPDRDALIEAIEAVARDIVRQCGGDFAKIAVLLAEQISVDGRWSPNVCKPLLRAHEIARGQI